MRWAFVYAREARARFSLWRTSISASDEFPAERATLPSSSDVYRLLIEGIVDYAIYLIDANGYVASWNAGARRMKGYDDTDVIGKHFSLFYTPADRSKGEPSRAIRFARERGKFEAEGWRVRKDGSCFWASVVVDALRDGTGEIIGFAKVTRDVTERSIREEQRQIIVDAAPNGMLLIDEAGSITYANAQAERILHAPPNSLVGCGVDALLGIGELLREMPTHGPAAPRQLTGHCLDGRHVPLEATFVQTPTARGQVAVASVVDITDRLRVEEARRKSEAALLEGNRLMSMAEEMAHYGHWRRDLQSNEIFWSDEVYRSRGYPKSYQPTIEAGLAAYDPDGVDVAAILERASIDGKPFTYETRVRHADGSFRDVRVSGRGEFAGGALVALVGIYQDVTNLKNTERERDRLVERVTLATQAGKVGIWEWDVAADNMLWDQRMFALHGLDENVSDVNYHRWIGAIHEADRDRVIYEIDQALAGESFDTEFRVVWPSGDVHILRAQATVVHDNNKRATRMVGTHWDITEVRSLTEQLREEKERQAAYERERLYEHERKWSTTFQRAVLPLNLPNVLGCEFDAVYEPGLGDAQVGGDWYDAVRLIDGRILISIGDVAGNGLEAAVVVGVVRQIMRGIAQLHANPMLILDAADRALSLEYPGVYVTAWVGIVDLVTRTITYASAGHPPPLIVSTDARIRELSETTLPIGLRDGHQGQPSTLALTDGDMLVLYTDGVTEATRDVIAGQASLHAAAFTLAQTGSSTPATHIKQQVIPHGSHDDVAILVVRLDFVLAEQHLERWQFDAGDPQAASAARRRFVRSLSEHGFSADDVANAELVFGELIGNVVRHVEQPGDAAIVVDFSGARTVLHVMDRGAGFRHISRLPPDPYAENGRGLFLIAAMTAEFTVAERPDGGSHARAVLIDYATRSFADSVSPFLLSNVDLDRATEHRRKSRRMHDASVQLSSEIR